MEFMECRECNKKPGSPSLCVSCLNNRNVIKKLKEKIENNGKPEKRAWSDFPDHILIRIGGGEYGIDTRIALKLYLDLKEAIKDSL